MLTRLICIAAAVFASGGSALAQQGNAELLNSSERLQALDYGLKEACLPAQRAGQNISAYEQAHRRELKLNRARVSNSTQVNMWIVGGSSSDVAVMEDPAGCTVSMSFWEDSREKIVPDVRALLTGSADQYQVVSGDPDDKMQTLVVAFCAKNDEGTVDSWYLYEYLGEPEAVPRQKRRMRQQFISVIAPVEPFCPQQ